MARGFDAHDTFGVVTNATTLHFDGYSFAAQYIDQNDDPNNVGQTENSVDGSSGGSLTLGAAISDLLAGLPIVSIFETNAMGTSPYDSAVAANSSQEIIGSYLTTSQGVTDGTEAVA